MPITPYMVLFTNKIPHPLFCCQYNITANNYIVWVVDLITSQWLCNCDITVQVSCSRECFSQHIYWWVLDWNETWGWSMPYAVSVLVARSSFKSSLFRCFYDLLYQTSLYSLGIPCGVTWLWSLYFYMNSLGVHQLYIHLICVCMFSCGHYPPETRLMEDIELRDRYRNGYTGRNNWWTILSYNYSNPPQHNCVWSNVIGWI